MSISSNSPHDYAFNVLIKEAEFLRSESLLCIENVRRLAVYSTYIAGFALPIIGGFLSAKEGGVGIASVSELSQAIEKNLLIIQFVCLGVSLSCLAFLKIYVGNFLQIFTFAKYFREHISPSITKIVKCPDVELFHWEPWLKKHRGGKSLFIGDVDLAAEPILIGLYTLTYGTAFVAIGYFSNSFPISSIFIGTIILISTSLSFLKFIRVLKSAAND